MAETRRTRKLARWRRETAAHEGRLDECPRRTSSASLSLLTTSPRANTQSMRTRRRWRLRCESFGRSWAGRGGSPGVAARARTCRPRSTSWCGSVNDSAAGRQRAPGDSRPAARCAITSGCGGAERRLLSPTEYAPIFALLRWLFAGASTARGAAQLPLTKEVLMA
jgi:hypothetical protein